MDREGEGYDLTVQWLVSVDGVDIGRVAIVAGGYMAHTVSDEPMYPHLGEGDQHGVVHGTVAGAASELVTWAQKQSGPGAERPVRPVLQVVS